MKSKKTIALKVTTGLMAALISGCITGSAPAPKEEIVNSDSSYETLERDYNEKSVVIANSNEDKLDNMSNTDNYDKKIIHFYTWYQESNEEVYPIKPENTTVLFSRYLNNGNEFVGYVLYFSKEELSEDEVARCGLTYNGEAEKEFFYMLGKTNDNDSEYIYLSNNCNNGDQVIGPVENMDYAPMYLIYDIDYDRYLVVSKHTIDYLNREYEGHFYIIGFAHEENMVKYETSISKRDIYSDFAETGSKYFIEAQKNYHKEKPYTLNLN